MRGRRGTRLVLAAAAAVAVVVGTGCGDDGGPAALAPSSTAATARSSTTTTAPRFDAEVSRLTAADLASSWRPGCPVPVEDLRAIDASFWGFDGEVHQGRIVVHADVVDDVTGVLRDLFEARYPIHRMEPIDRYGGSDDASVDADNTSGFNCRLATGSTTSWSEHAYGRAIDLNPLRNPFVVGGRVLPEQSRAYLDRTRTEVGVIHDGDAAVTAFESRGWTWGGHWRTSKDYQHFSPSGR